MCETLLQAGAEVVVFDPKVSAQKVQTDLAHLSAHHAQLKSASSAPEACVGADAAIVLTEWDQFKSIDWSSVVTQMSPQAWVFDARNCLNHAHIKTAGLNLWVVGKAPTK